MQADHRTGAPGAPSARELARAATVKSGVNIRTLHDVEELEQLASVFAAVWRTPEGEIPISAHMLRALELAGSYVAAAFGPSGEMIGGSVAFAAVTTPVELHSHVTGVLGCHAGTAVGLALKLDQRAWALERGITSVVWTFDPLVRRNAVFSLAKLGASVTGYLHNVYGLMSDELNARDESDRLLVTWHLDDAVVKRALACGERLVLARDLAPLELSPGPRGEPIRALVAEGEFRVRVPHDIEAMRASHRQFAQDWRYALRDVLGTVLASGGAVLGLDSEGDYVVTKRLEEGPG
jgi:predicted GNAT superfamily acetyltransferase